MPDYNFENLCVLVVDDNRHMRTLLRDLLRSLGVGTVIEANDGMSGFQKLKQAAPDIIVTDLLMQPIDGLQFARMVRNENRSPQPFVPIIMVTGFADKLRVTEARDAGVTEFLAKPVTTEAMYARLESIIEKPRPFVKTGDFFGPDRRRHKAKPPAEGGRRLEDVESRCASPRGDPLPPASVQPERAGS